MLPLPYFLSHPLLLGETKMPPHLKDVRIIRVPQPYKPLPTGRQPLRPTRMQLLLLLLIRLGGGCRAGRLGRVLLLVAVDLVGLLPILALGVPLAGLQHEDADQDEGEDGVARGQDLQAVLAAEDDLAAARGVALGQEALELVRVPVVGADHAQALDDVGDVDADADEVHEQGGAVEEHVGLGGAEELREEAEEPQPHHDVEHAADQRRRPVQELEVRLQLVQVRGLDGVARPQQRVVVREHGEEDAEEEERR